MLRTRTLARTLLKAARTFPAVVVTGPRQSGKTTLLKAVFSKTHRFTSLEDPDVRIRAKEDPAAFLQENPPPVILDEIQYFPELLSYVKTRIDRDRKAGQWLFTGSQNFSLMHGLSQSLAGRVAVLSLLPFSFSEKIGDGGRTEDPVRWLETLGGRKARDRGFSLAEQILRGGYPEIASRKSVDRQLWCGSYISTYLERDVRNLAQIGDLSQFERFLKLCAIRTGQLLNYTDLSREIGASVPTVRRWISILETGYQVYLLYPYYKNIGKRLVKAPKLYFNDTALASYLLGLHERETLLNSPSFGNLFETLIVTDVLKRFLHFGQMPSLYYLRTYDGLEVDLVLEIGQKLHLLEIKNTMTLLPRHALSLRRAAADLRPSVGRTAVLSRAATGLRLAGGVVNVNWAEALAV